ncbi:hypothetical protein GLA29479_2394 [Lysobacter antibioticus]|nr:hypothetical protein GLA29479_2394 [Lysobacter antibioticus]
MAVVEPRRRTDSRTIPQASATAREGLTGHPESRRGRSFMRYAAASACAELATMRRSVA